MKLHELAPNEGATKKPKRKGRGIGTGNGKTAGRGHGGQNSRSGGGTRIGFEGGQMPLVRRVPKRGFNNIFAKPLVSVNISALEDRFESGATVTIQSLIDAGLISKPKHGVKVLAKGELTKALTVQVSAFSESAKAKIEAAGGKAEVV